MTTASIAKTGLGLVAGCSVGLLVVAGGCAFAHSGGDHNGNDHNGDGSHGRCIECGGNGASLGDSSNHYHRHRHHHHHPTMTGDGPPLHGPGSSHNPIVYHPVHGPGSSHSPIIVPVTVVRDHRQYRPHHGYPSSYRDRMCRAGHLSYCSKVRDHRTPTGTQCLGDLC